MNPSTHPENFDLCRNCGNPYCGRLIEKSDGSIRASHDTGYRFNPVPHKQFKIVHSKYTAPFKRRHALCISRQEAMDNAISEQRLAGLAVSEEARNLMQDFVKGELSKQDLLNSCKVQ